MNNLIEALALMAEIEGMKACNAERLAAGMAKILKPTFSIGVVRQYEAKRLY